MALFSSRDKLSDKALIQTCLEGDALAWDALLDRYKALIYSVLRRTGLSSADADDQFQNVCITLFQHLGQLRETAKLGGWLASTARREAWRHLKSRKGDLQSELPDHVWESSQPIDGLSSQMEAPGDQLLLIEQQNMVRNSLGLLQQKCKLLLTLLYLRDPAATYGEITELTGMPFGSIGPTRARCLQNLLKQLREHGF